MRTWSGFLIQLRKRVNITYSYFKCFFFPIPPVETRVRDPTVQYPRRESLYEHTVNLTRKIFCLCVVYFPLPHPLNIVIKYFVPPTNGFTLVRYGKRWRQHRQGRRICPEYNAKTRKKKKKTITLVHRKEETYGRCTFSNSVSTGAGEKKTSYTKPTS